MGKKEKVSDGDGQDACVKACVQVSEVWRGEGESGSVYAREEKEMGREELGRDILSLPQILSCSSEKE